MNQHREQSARGVVLPAGHTGSSLFHAVLADAAAQFPEDLGAARFPERAGEFKRDYGAILARFEALRVTSPRRVEIARFIVRKTQAALLYAQDGKTQPLAEHLAEPASAPSLQRTPLGDAPSLRAQVPFEGTVHRGREVIALAERLADHHELTHAALRALRWIVEEIETRGGVLDLRSERFVLLGAGAELAATRMLLAAGATVLWVDVADPSAALGANRPSSGTIVQAEGAGNLLEAPRAIGAAIERFTDQEGPAHLGLFAYASGASQEWRLGAAMTAIATRLDAQRVRSLSLLVSPTTTATLQPECVQAAADRLGTEPFWKAALRRGGLLPAPGDHEANGAHIARATVSLQGLSYQAAQYISKLAAAECFAVHGLGLEGDERRPITVSANVAGITRTRSLSHPLFQAAFVGAPRFGVRIFEPQTTRALSGLLILHDLLNPAAPGAAAVQPSDSRAKVAALFSQQIHGGIYALPYVLEQAIRIAAVIGMGSQPSVLLRRSGSREARA